MRARVVAQGFTVVALALGTFFVAGGDKQPTQQIMVNSGMIQKRDKAVESAWLNQVCVLAHTSIALYGILFLRNISSS